MQRPCGKREPKDTDKAPGEEGVAGARRMGLRGSGERKMEGRGGERKIEGGGREETERRGGGGIDGQEPNHPGFVGLSAKVGALSLSRDQRGSGKALSRAGLPTLTNVPQATCGIFKERLLGCILGRPVRRPCHGPEGGQDMGPWC